MKPVLRVATLQCLALVLACAQNASFLKGTVSDSSGGAVPSADCVLTESHVGRVLTATSWTDGTFRFANVVAGSYDLKVRASGFNVLVTKVELRVSETVEVNLVLEVGPVAGSIEVRPEPALIDTASSTHSHAIDQRRILDLPVSGGNPIELAFLASGMITNRGMLPMKAPYNGTAISADGSPPFTNEFQLDGISNTFADGAGQARDAFRPPPASIREFKIQTTPYDASLGRTIGGTVSVVSAGGANQLHGEAHYWAKNSAFDAPNFFNNKYNTAVTPYADHRYGASAGGPVRLPGVYNGANRTFWHHTWESNQWGMPQTYLATVPSAAERQGDLSELLRLGSAYQVFDPFTTTPAPGGRLSRLPLAGNIIPASRLERTGVSLANLYPLPNQAGRADGLNNYFHSSTASEDYYVHVTRIDHAFGEKDRAFVRAHYDNWIEHKNDYYGDQLNGVVLMRVNRGLALSDVHVFSPAMILSLRYGISNQEFPESRSSRGYDLTKLGFSRQLTSLIDSRLATVPRFTAGVFSPYSAWESGDGSNSGLTHALTGSLSRLRGAHTLNFGADARVYRAFGARFPFSVSPDLAFSNAFTRGPMDNSPAAPAGQELAAMLLGIPAGSMAMTGSSALQDQFLALFVHDDFQVSRRLTINIGLRYEVEAPMTERYNRLVAGFAFDQANPIEAQARANYAGQGIPGIPAGSFRVRGGQTFVADRGAGRSPFRGETNNFLPRFGFAYRLRPLTTLRGGYGIYYDSIGVNAQVAIQSGFSQTTPIQASLDNGLTFAATTSNPFPQGLIRPPGAKGGLLTNLGQNLSFYDRDLKQPYSQRWSFGFQHLFPDSWLLDASYLGNHAIRLPVAQALNEVPAQYLSTSPARDQPVIDSLSAVFASPFQGIDPIFGTSVSRGGMLRPYPEFGSITVKRAVGYSTYHSLQTRLEKRFSHGYTFQLSYTWSKLMTGIEYLNATDRAPARTIGSFDRRHRLASSGIWDIPGARRLPKPLRAVAAAWQLGGLVSIQSGPPLGFGNVIFNGRVEDIPLSAGQRGADRWFNIDAGFNRDSSQQLSYNLRTFALRLSGLHADVLSRWDFSLIRNFRLREKFTFQFRAEVFNAWNHPSFAGPNLNPTSTGFGTITATANESRQWQFSGRVKF
jgi:hypothetical protein